MLTQHKIYSQQTFGVQYIIFNYRHSVVQRISRTYSSCVTEILYSLNSNPLLFFPCTPWQPPFYSLLLSLTVLDTSYKWTHAVFLLLWVANTWRYLWLWIETLNVVKISMQPREIYRCNGITIKISMAFFTGKKKKTTSKIIWNCKRQWKTKTILKKKNKAGQITFPDFKIP